MGHGLREPPQLESDEDDRQYSTGDNHSDRRTRRALTRSVLPLHFLHERDNHKNHRGYREKNHARTAENQCSERRKETDEHGRDEDRKNRKEQLPAIPSVDVASYIPGIGRRCMIHGSAFGTRDSSGHIERDVCQGVTTVRTPRCRNRSIGKVRDHGGPAHSAVRPAGRWAGGPW
jgi:hypothetical protein